MTECSICYDTISAQTGQVVLACSHVYHLGCVGRWLLEHQSCPLCRAEPCEKEKIAAPQEEEEEEDEEEEDEVLWADDRDTLPEFDEEAHAFWVMRATFERLDAEQSISPEPTATKDLPEFDRLPSVRDRQNWGSRLIWVMEEERGYCSS